MSLVGGYLKEHREALGMTQGDFGARLGFSRAHLCELEKGRKGFSLERAVWVAKRLGLDERLLAELVLQDLLDAARLPWRVRLR